MTQHCTEASGRSMRMSLQSPDKMVRFMGLVRGITTCVFTDAFEPVPVGEGTEEVKEVVITSVCVEILLVTAAGLLLRLLSGLSDWISGIEPMVSLYSIFHVGWNGAWCGFGSFSRWRTKYCPLAPTMVPSMGVVPPV